MCVLINIICGVENIGGGKVGYKLASIGARQRWSKHISPQVNKKRTICPEMGLLEENMYKNVSGDYRNNYH